MQQSAKCLWGWHHKFKLQGELYMSGRLGFPTQLKKKKNSLVMDLEELYMSCRLGFLSQLQKRKYIPYV